jgi:hypothetical protein
LCSAASLHGWAVCWALFVSTDNDGGWHLVSRKREFLRTFFG